MTALRFMLITVLLVCASHAQAQPTSPGQLPVMTRFMKIFMEQEQQLLQAIRDKNTAAMEPMLAVNFEMRMAHQAGQPVPRGEWMKSAAAHTGAQYTISQMAVQEVGNVAIASFVLTPTASGRDVATEYVVDTWIPDGETWKLRVRHATVLATQHASSKQAHLIGEPHAAQAVDTRKKY